ncbi:MAG: DNA primase [Caldilineales bacterium]|nr:DNA primase [Caldilineales bacterium]
MNRSVTEEVKSRLDIVDVVGQYVALQKSGRNYKAVCPFHNEKTPSFYVFPDTGTWHCFGACGTGGDVIRFIEKRENLDFREALRLLAARAGVDLDLHKDPETLSRENLLLEINALAAAYFQHQLLQTPAGAQARAYLTKREIEQATIEQFQIGYAPDGWDHLLSYLQGRGHNLDDIEAAGLVVRRDDGGGYDRFRHRVVIPIRDAQGRVIGFGGRILGDGEPKYLNTPQTILFDKSETIFALDLAKRAIRARGHVVLVEGYMDVISAHQRGFTNVVAAMGTSVTPPQLKRLSRYTNEYIFALDADAAGIQATLRSIHTARESLANASIPVPTARGGIRYETRLSAVIKIAVMPAGLDPDDVLRQGKEHWQALIDAAIPLVEYVIEQAVAQADLGTAQGKAELVKELLPTISEIDDVIERRHYVGRLAALAGVTEREIDNELERYARALSRARSRAATTPPPFDQPPPPDEFPDSMPVQAPAPRNGRREDKIEVHILAHVLIEPDMLSWADRELAQSRFLPLNADDFEAGANRAIFDARHEFRYSCEAQRLDRVSDEPDLALDAQLAILTPYVRQLDNLHAEQKRKDLVDSILRIRLGRVQRNCRELETVIRTVEIGSEQSQIELYAQLSHLLKERARLEQTISSRSHSSHWWRDRKRLSG